MDAAAAQTKLLSNRCLGSLFRTLCGAFGKEVELLRIVAIHPDGLQRVTAIHKYNQRGPIRWEKCSTYNIQEVNGLEENCFVVQVRVVRAMSIIPFHQLILVRVERDGKRLRLNAFDNNRPNSTELEKGLNRWFDLWFGEMNRSIGRCLSIKRDLMENRWHPDRVMRLLEAGIEVEDM
jgi:hypothetical protein